MCEVYCIKHIISLSIFYLWLHYVIACIFRSGVRMYTRIKLLILKEVQLSIYIEFNFEIIQTILEYAYEHRCKRGVFFAAGR